MTNELMERQLRIEQLRASLPQELKESEHRLLTVPGMVPANQSMNVIMASQTIYRADGYHGVITCWFAGSLVGSHVMGQGPPDPHQAIEVANAFGDVIQRLTNQMKSKTTDTVDWSPD